MDLSQEQPIRRFEAGETVSAADRVVTEIRLELDINDGESRLAMLCLPQDLEALAVGFLLGEGVLRRVEDLEEVRLSPSEPKVLIRGDLDAEALEALHSRWTWGSGCGGGGTSRELTRPALLPAGAGPTVTPEKLLQLTHDFHRGTVLWRRTGGVHACALADTQRLILSAEDVGRHNAFDKIMGMAAMKRIPINDKLVLTTGRLSAEIVSKAVACGVAMLASRSAATSLAVTLGRRFGLTLVGFLRGQRMNVYTGYERVLAEAGNETEKQP